MTYRRTLVLIPTCALLAATVPIVARATSPASTASSASKKTVCAQLKSVTVDADGDTHHLYAFANGLSTDAVVPAASLDPDTSPSARFKKFGLPTRPAAGSADRAAWDGLVQGLKRKRTAAAPCIDVGLSASLPDKTLHNYAGWEAHAASGKTFSGAHMSMTAPTYYLSTCSNETMTQWIGVSDANAANVLVQAGLYVNQDTGNGLLDSGGFLEFVGGSWDTTPVYGGIVRLDTGPGPGSVPYIAGDRYYFSVQYEDRYDWGITAEDLDNPDYTYSQSWHNAGAGGTQYIQPAAFAISERMSVNGVFTQYMNHSTVSFRTTMAHIDAAGDARFSIENPQRIIMKNVAETTQLSSVSALDSSTSNFYENWLACGQAEPPPGFPTG